MGDRIVGWAGGAIERRPGEQQEHALQVFGQGQGALDNGLPFRHVASLIGIDSGARIGEQLPELRQVERRARDAENPAAYQKILIQQAYRPERRVGFAEQLGDSEAELALAFRWINERRLRGWGWYRFGLRQLGQNIRWGRWKLSAVRMARCFLRRGWVQDQTADRFGRGFGQRDQFGADAARLCFDRAYAQCQWTPRQRGAERDELPGLKVPEHFRLTAFHAKEISGPRHVDIQEGSTHQEIGRLGGNVLCKFGEALRRDDAGEAALSPAAHQIGHRRQG